MTTSSDLYEGGGQARAGRRGNWFCGSWVLLDERAGCRVLNLALRGPAARPVTDAAGVTFARLEDGTGNHFGVFCLPAP